MEDKYNLTRFVTAQNDFYDNYEKALKEIINGQKINHWIWYIFPQLSGLGKSSNAVFYGITGLDEAKAYLSHPILGKRLKEISSALLLHKDVPAAVLMGSYIDAKKLKSSMTLFSLADPDELIFSKVLEVFFDGKKDISTITLLKY